jgi:hypothetical protein
LRSDIDQLPQTGLIRDLDPRSPINWRLYQLTKSLYGNLKAVAALWQIASDLDGCIPLDELIALLPKLLAQHHEPETWEEEIRRRVAAYGLGRW